MPDKELSASLSSDATYALVVGTKVFVSPLTADGQVFVFTKDQMRFFLALQDLKNPDAAALHVGKTSDWSDRFLASKKFKTFIHAKMQEANVKAGMTIEYWHQWGKWCMEGKKEWYEGTCAKCLSAERFTSYEVETARNDEMVIQMSCPVCFSNIQIEKKSELFKPTREQVEAWKEEGARLAPKIERVQHEFSREEFKFVSEGE